MSCVLFICSGNTCRSPMAEALARQSFATGQFFSRGIAASEGCSASKMAVKVMKDVYNIDIRGHVSRGVTEADVRGAALILTMTESHRESIACQFPFACDYLFTLSGFACPDSDWDMYDIADPYMGGFDIYAECAAQIKRYLDKIDFRNF